MITSSYRIFLVNTEEERQTLPAQSDGTICIVKSNPSIFYEYNTGQWISFTPETYWGNINGTLSNQTDLQTALDLKASLNSPTFTGTVGGITKAMVGLANVDNTADANKPVSTAQATADTATLNTAKAYADGLVVGLWDDRGAFDASVNLYPSSGGSGTAGAILKGDIWTVSVAGTLPTAQSVEVGDVVRALTDTPSNLQANWAITQNNIGYTAENSANKQTDLTESATKYPTVNAVNAGLATKQPALVSATNIKTINGSNILGSGDLIISSSGLTQQQVEGLI